MTDGKSERTQSFRLGCAPSSWAALKLYAILNSIGFQIVKDWLIWYRTIVSYRGTWVAK